MLEALYLKLLDESKLMLIKALPDYLMSTLAFSDAGALSFHHVKYPFKHQLFASFAFSSGC